MALLQAAYMAGAAGYPSMNIGINQLGHLGLPAAAASLLAVWPTAAGVSVPAVRKLGAGFRLPKRVPAILLEVLLAGLSVFVFLSLCNRFINRDGLNLFSKIPRDVARYGAHLTHDEMLELYVHSRLYYYAQKAFGWSVGQCYQVASAVAGGGFVLLLVRASRAWAPQSRLAFIGLVLSCGFVQLFFGDVENYTLVTLMILVYLAAAGRYLDGRAPLWWPSLALSIAIGFHLLAGWLLPSLAYLFLQARRQGRVREMTAGLVALALPLAWLLAFFHFSGLPIQRLWQTSHLGGMGGHFGRELSPLDPAYHWGMLNVMLLLWPTAVIVPALAIFRRLGSDPLSRFLQVASGAMIVFTFVWKAELGFLEDWNLFAPGMVPAAILVARSLCRLPPSRWRILVVLALFGTAGLHTAVWILSNHFVSR